jgi:hypothetical protein
VPILGNPEFLHSKNLRRFQWTGILAEGKRCHTDHVPCHTDLEKKLGADPTLPMQLQPLA